MKDLHKEPENGNLLNSIRIFKQGGLTKPPCCVTQEEFMNKFVLRQSLLLLLTATIWGVAFVAQSVGMDYVGPFTFNAVRSLIGGVVLLPCIVLLQKINKKDTAGAPEYVKEQPEALHDSKNIKSRDNGDVASVKKDSRKTLLTGGIACGTLLCIASNLQQFGIMYTSVGKAGFITAMYIVIVPVLGIFLRKKVGAKIWCGVGIAVVGLYLLCMTESGFSIQKGDFLLMLCAIVFSLHILVIDYFSPKTDGVKLSCIQFFTCGVLSAVGMFLTENPQISNILAAWMPILYAGVMSCGVAYTLQIIGQKGMNPTVASLILSMESVISVIAGWLILHQTLSTKELIGCLLMFAAIILVQLPDKKRA